jgi:hypothetical protein
MLGYNMGRVERWVIGMEKEKGRQRERRKGSTYFSQVNRLGSV